MKLVVLPLLMVLFASPVTMADEAAISPGGALVRSALWTAIPALTGGGGMIAGLYGKNVGIFALGTTTLGLGLGFGPDAGYHYAGERGHPGPAILRFLGVAGGTALLLVGSIQPGCTPDAPRYPDCPALSVPMEVAGGMLLAASGIWALYDVMGAPVAVRRANGSGRTAPILQPVVVRRQDSITYSLALSGKF